MINSTVCSGYLFFCSNFLAFHVVHQLDQNVALSVHISCKLSIYRNYQSSGVFNSDRIRRFIQLLTLEVLSFWRWGPVVWSRIRYPDQAPLPQGALWTRWHGSMGWWLRRSSKSLLGVFNPQYMGQIQPKKPRHPAWKVSHGSGNLAVWEWWQLTVLPISCCQISKLYTAGLGLRHYSWDPL